MKKIIVGITAPQSIDLLTGQLKYFSDKGYEIYLMAPESERVTEFCRNEGATHLPIDIERDIKVTKDIRTFFSILSVLRKVKPDVVNFGTPKVSLLGLTAARLLGVKKRIYTCRGFRYEHEQGNFKKFLMNLERITSSSAHKVLCISKSVEELGIRDGIFPAHKTFHIGKGSSNGIDLELFDPSKINPEDVEDFKRHHGLLDKFVFGYVGRLVDRKGIRELYEAFDSLYSKNDACRLLVIGRPYPDQIRDLDIIEKYNNHPGIVMMGLQPLEKIPFFLSVMHTFVLPAYWEGFGNVLIQAAAMGVPIISTRVTGCRDAVSDGFNGVLLPTWDPKLLEEEMKRFMEDPAGISVYGENGKSWAENFDPRIIWQGLEEAYND